MDNSRHIILGIDPSVRGTGLGVIEIQGRSVLKCLYHQTIHIPQKVRFSAAIHIVADKIREIIPAYQVQEASIEEPPYVQNMSVYKKLCSVYGSILEALEGQDIPAYEFTPPQIKQSSTGYGKSEKDSVQKYVKWIFSLSTLPESDSADALAAALTLANCYNQLIPSKLKRL